MNKRIYEIKVRLAADEMAHLNRLVPRNLFTEADFESCPKECTRS